MASFFASAQAQQPIGPQPLVGQIALLDVQAVFKNHARFKTSMENLDPRHHDGRGNRRTEAGRHQNLAATLEEVPGAGTPEYQQLAAEVTKRQSDLTVKVQMEKKTFQQRESEMYHSTYREILAAVDEYASQTGIVMVMRYNSDSVDVQKPEQVELEVGKSIVWTPRGRDITAIIIDKVNRGESNSQVGPELPHGRASAPQQR